MGKNLNKKTKNKKLLLLTSLGALAFPISVIACSSSDNKKPEGGNPLDQIAPNPNPAKPAITPINSFNNFDTKIISRNIERNINKEFYETEITRQYGDAFKYPAWNFNYEYKNDKEHIDNRFQTINGQKIDGMQLVWDERVIDDSGSYVLNAKGEKIKYTDASFIKSEIQKGTLKKHPASKVWFEQQISDNEKAVNKTFSIPSYTTGPTSLGLYIPPGEIGTLTFNSETLRKMKEQNINNFKLVINSSFWDNKVPGNTGQISNRYPYLRTEFDLSVSELEKNGGSFKFGTPFGGTLSVKVKTRLKSNSFNDFYSSYDNYKFSVEGALEILSYYHTFTSKTEWNEQVRRVLNNEITSPALSLDFSFGSMNIESTGINEFAHKKLKDIDYPFQAFERWTSFLFISQYFSSRDINDNVVKLDFEFNDDVWGNAVGWGGGDALFAGLGWANEAFLSGFNDWTIAANWGTFHEINHNFQQNGAFFQKTTHPKTNEVSMNALSLLSDNGRWRSIYNPRAEFALEWWSRLQNMYATIKYLIIENKRKPIEYEYELQNILLNVLGTYNYMKYVRYDVNNSDIRGGFNEIIELSDYFKLNFWPALENYYPIWNDNWPSSYSAANDIQKKEIDRISSQYKAFDFVSNVYGAGAYIYNNDTNMYDYTNDMQAAIDIPAGKPYVLDFEKGILSTNENFSWSKMSFDKTSKLGSKIYVDPSNSKRLIYEPAKNIEGQIDEFNFSIIPDNFVDKPRNYVSEYIWKIKLRSNAIGPVMTLFKEPLVKNNNSSFFDKEYQYLRDKNNELVTLNADPNFGYQFTDWEKTNNWNRGKISFKFIAPKDGSYNFRVKADSWMFIINEKNPDSAWWKPNFVPNKKMVSVHDPITMKKGETLNLSIYFTYKTNKMLFDAIVDNDVDNPINVFDHCVVPWANDLIDQPIKYLEEEKYQYKPRKLNLNDFQTSLYGLNVSREVNSINKIEEVGNSTNKNYEFQSVKPNVKEIDKKLSFDDLNYLEEWGNPTFEVNFNVVFTKPTAIRTIIFTHRTNNWSEGRPTWMRIKDQNNNILYEGNYGTQNNDRHLRKSFFMFDSSKNVTKLQFEFKNEKVVNPSKGTSAIIFDAINFSSDLKLKTNKVYSTQDNNITYNGNWEMISNDENVNISYVNRISALSKKENDFIEFELYAQGFDVVGQKNANNAIFDIYINDQLVSTVDTSSSSRQDNCILYSFTSNNSSGEKMKIKIVNKTNKNLFINYFQTYGSKTYLG